MLQRLVIHGCERYRACCATEIRLGFSDMRIFPQMFTGQELLEAVKANSHLSRGELMIACGYGTANEMEFAKALLEAKGVFLEADSVRIGRAKGLTRKKRGGSGVVKVHFNGAVVLGKPYTREMSVEPGDKFDVIVGRNYIKLVPQGRGAEANVAAPACAPACAPRLPVTISEEQPERALVAV